MVLPLTDPITVSHGRYRWVTLSTISFTFYHDIREQTSYEV